jgi:hypothetical protein
MPRGQSDRGEVCIRSYTVGELDRGVSLFEAYDDPNGYLKSFRNSPRLIVDNPNAQKDDLALVLAFDGQKVIGRLGLFAGRLFYEGENLRVYWLSEFALQNKYKTTGVGGMVLLKVLALRVPLLACGAPSEELEKVYEKVGFRRLGPLKRFVHFYRTTVVARHYLNNAFLARTISSIVNPALALYYSFRRRGLRQALTYKHVKQFDNTISSLFTSERRNHCIKDALVLNWALNHNHADAFEIYDGPNLRGYCVIKSMKFDGGGSHDLPEMNMGTLLDYYIQDVSREALCDLLLFCIDRFANQGLDLFEFQVCDEMLCKVCGEFGLTQIGGNRIFIKPGLNMGSRGKREWFLTLGTADVILMGA